MKKEPTEKFKSKKSSLKLKKENLLTVFFPFNSNLFLFLLPTPCFCQQHIHSYTHASIRKFTSLHSSYKRPLQKKRRIQHRHIYIKKERV